MELYLKRVLNFIQMINVYGNENKYDLKKVDIFQVIISKSEHL
jgi:hypothetical protein